MSIKKKKHELKVIFDTNAIFSGSASDLFKKEIPEIIENYSKLPDLEITWYLPEIVVEERRFQMNKKGIELLPSIQKLEKLLGHNLNITEEIIHSRIDETISRQIDKHNIIEIKIDPTRINWHLLINKSVRRLPPFEDSDKEKGFRDALIIECVQHLIDNSPSSSTSCRLAFLTGDQLLTEAAKERFSNVNNLRLCSSTEELISLINILTSEIKEDLINSISENVSSLFFTEEDNSTLYYKEEIRKKITEKFSKELNYLPENSTRREEGTWWLNKPGFVKKVGQRMFWKTILEIDCKIYKTTFTPSASPLGLDYLSSNQKSPMFKDVISRITSGIKEELVKEGKSKVEILWSVTLTTTKQLKNPKIDEINFIETGWK